MKSKAVFYHAGCPVCLDAERQITTALDRDRFEIEIVHLGTAKARVAEAAKLGRKALLLRVRSGDQTRFVAVQLKKG